MNLSVSQRKYILLGLVVFVLLGTVTASIMGKKQDKVFQLNDLEYNQVVQQLQDGNYVEAFEASRHLENRQVSSEAVNYIIALAAANFGNVEKGLNHMQRTLDINPHRVESSVFMLQYAEFLIMVDRNDDAMEVLNRCATLPIPESYPQYQERVIQLQEQIAVRS